MDIQRRFELEHTVKAEVERERLSVISKKLDAKPREEWGDAEWADYQKIKLMEAGIF